MIKKLHAIVKFLSAKYLEREDVIWALMLCLLARQNIFLKGLPGTAKSGLINDLAKCIGGVNRFSWLLGKFTSPEEIFGPTDLNSLQTGVYKRVTKNKLPEAHIAFLDETFKANSAILNALLTIANERVFYNNGNPEKVPLMTLMGASNEYPEEGEGLEALFDRFLVKFEVNYIGEDANFVKMLQASQTKIPELLTLEELKQIQFLVDMVTIPDTVYKAIAELRTSLKTEGIIPSDRQFSQSLSLIQASAIYNEREHANLSDMLILKHVLWNQPDQKEKVGKLVEKYAEDRLKNRLKEIAKEAKSIYGAYQKAGSSEAGIEAMVKLKELIDELREEKAKNPNREAEIQTLYEELNNTRIALSQKTLGLGKGI